jgi:Zn-dependent M28 family amino/carboxypeptidase
MKLFLLIFFTGISLRALSQDDAPVSEKEVERILNFLSSDSLKGRKNHSTELQKAAYFIAGEFRKDSLLYFFNDTSYFQPFATKKLSKKGWQAVAGPPYDPGKILLNVVGVLEGKSKPEEIVIFSAHYDHIGTNKSKRGDNIYNGANDNASGTAAVISLAHYFAKTKNNERTIVFCAFAGEELGLLGSRAFVNTIKPEKIVAIINIEMIGDTNFFGKNSFFVTGSHLSNLVKIFEKNLKAGTVKIEDDPSYESRLFQRSDNYPFALKGIPAHSVMSSDDTSSCYHATCDEVDRIDISNMTNLIKAIITATASIIDGKDTPSRINNSFY